MVIERFTQRANQTFGPNHHFKSVVRPRYVKRFDNPHYARLKRGHYINSLGQPLVPRKKQQGKPWYGLSEHVTWEGARVNHYLVRSVEEFVLGKSKRGSATTANYYKQRDYFMRHDRNDTACHLAAELAPKVKEHMKWLQQLADKKQAMSGSKTNEQANKASSTESSSGSELTRWFKRRLKELSSTATSGQPPIERWALDYPSEQRGARFLPSGRVVQGWLLLTEELADMQSQVRIVAEWHSAFELCHPLDVDRPDVIKSIFSVPAETHPQRTCGFRFTVPPKLGNFRLWLALDDARWLLHEVTVDTQDVEIAEQLKVLQGKQGWLFLDNDTNGSVDQFMGRMRLTKAGIKGWDNYLHQLENAAGNVPWALLVAPSKESVMGASYHPREEGVSGPMHQLLNLSASAGVVYPVKELKALGDGAFIPTDTHWTHHGALAATIALAVKLGVGKKACMALFKKDRYKNKSMGGDLGNKLTPKQTSSVDVLVSFGHTRYKTYDNGLPNFGRLLVIEYPEALMSGTCLIFGSSSSYSMFNYLCRVFQRIVFVHSAGNVDPELVKAVAPAYLATQTNARFLVQIPTVTHSLDEVIHQKCAQLDEKAFEDVHEKRIIAPDDYLQTLGLLRWEQVASSLLV
ncbi:alginate O-acetyltransferase AlgX-related protein [Vreelandella andesensis]|uniref:alginate O-acetyltransferase AlgX-related protein n=1 Tax=Vreelandella andesensis TaxID=447567 RepID=UPI001FC933A5|nr:glycosyltransferase [Halomonas andesensis]